MTKRPDPKNLEKASFLSSTSVMFTHKKVSHMDLWGLGPWFHRHPRVIPQTESQSQASRGRLPDSASDSGTRPWDELLSVMTPGLLCLYSHQFKGETRRVSKHLLCLS